MIIQCEKCKRKFKVDDSEIITPGSKVRCSNCGHDFSAVNNEVSYGEESLENGQEDLLTDGKADKSGNDSPLTHDSDQGAPADNSYALTDNDRTGDLFKVDSDEIQTEGAIEKNKSSSAQDDYASGIGGPPGREEKNEFKDYADKLDADTVTDDGGNWEDFVSISKTEEETGDFELNRPPDTEDQGFKWENLRIDHEPVDIPDRLPQLFEDEDGDTENSDKPNEAERERASYQRKSPESLAIDMDVLSNNPRYQKRFSGMSGRSSYKSPGLHPSRSKPGRGVFGGIAYGIIAAAVFTVIITASYIILLNTGLIPKETSDKIRNFAQSIIPLELSERGRNDVIITEHRERWMNTRNGPLYIVSGTITNRAAQPVHFVKIHSEFLSAGQILFENDVYAGNTFTDNELKVSPLQDILLKLKNRNGNIDYYNTNKLAGLNYNIQPGESIPFYTVYLPQSKVLGLRYNLRIADYEDSAPN